MISSILMTSSFVLQASTPYRHGLSSRGTGRRVVLSQAREAYDAAIERGARTAILVELAESEALAQEAHTTRPQAKLGDLPGSVLQLLKIDGLLSGVLLVHFLLLSCYACSLLILVLDGATAACVLVVSLVLLHTCASFSLFRAFAVSGLEQSALI